MLRSYRLRNVWMILGPIAAFLLVFTGIYTLRMPGKAHAAGVTLYVGSFVGLNTGCSSPGFTSIQSAVDIAPIGATVYLCGTTPYAEQVIIQKSITLTGDPGATITAPGTFSTPLSRLPLAFTTDSLFVPQAIVIIWGSGVNVKIKNINIAGVMPGNGGCAEDEFGVLVIDGGNATLSGDTVKDIRDTNSSLYGCQFGVGIQIGRQYWPTANFSTYLVEDFVGHAYISNTTVTGYQKNGITVDGPGTTATLSYNTVNGAGQSDTTLSPIIAQNGIQISRGASAKAYHNTVTGNSYTGPNFASSGGILVYGGSCDGPATPLTTGTSVQQNTLQNNDVGVFISNLSLDNNSLCSLPITATNVVAKYNVISNIAVTNVSGPNLLGYPGGYQAGISDEGNSDQMIKNQICGIGYTSVTPPPYLSQIDVVATNPIAYGNTTCILVAKTSASPSPQKVKRGHVRNVSSPIK